jgi:hypothetical protein
MLLSQRSPSEAEHSFNFNYKRLDQHEEKKTCSNESKAGGQR